MRFDDQAQFHPLKYLFALVKEIPGDGSYIFEHTKVVDIDDRDKEPFPDGMFINAEEPARSLRSQKYSDSEIILVGGDNHQIYL